MQLPTSKKILMISALLLGLFQTMYAGRSLAQSGSDADIEQAVLKQINSYRLKHGMGQLTMSPQMVREARQHSVDMARHRVPFGHTYFLGRIKRLRSEIKNTGAGAENVAYNYKDAEDVVRNWLKSPGHKRNIDGNYNLTGVGIARDNKGKMYFTQLFLQARKSSY